MWPCSCLKDVIGRRSGGQGLPAREPQQRSTEEEASLTVDVAADEESLDGRLRADAPEFVPASPDVAAISASHAPVPPAPMSLPPAGAAKAAAGPAPAVTPTVMLPPARIGEAPVVYPPQLLSVPPPLPSPFGAYGWPKVYGPPGDARLVVPPMPLSVGLGLHVGAPGGCAAPPAGEVAAAIKASPISTPDARARAQAAPQSTPEAVAAPDAKPWSSRRCRRSRRGGGGANGGGGGGEASQQQSLGNGVQKGPQPPYQPAPPWPQHLQGDPGAGSYLLGLVRGSSGGDGNVQKEQWAAPRSGAAGGAAAATTRRGAAGAGGDQRGAELLDMLRGNQTQKRGQNKISEKAREDTKQQSAQRRTDIRKAAAAARQKAA
eukprot:TRINITY_DN22033_c0_g1_i1.p1 TRINITY_DN22033_c0_g1~~TRINITY_DN22033_c0_g1_i1.p1  ORF type:complete len:376 (-),score=87.21 TRINITY_DN22033_c0_g1_i1:98-1225(-)